ncbi:dienelactone hydrolase family protein [Ramlibacter sp. AW1]|uniref:Dienelactone hydrolase family protein n=1 Tax=Ramlibacter aurantiacus TaxID=2801330 RepID=A0A937D4F3_9BURK|nr:acyl-CoA thioester hydrolase/BAAT C-terminal domain-containing protein [Ramlibacter aurantiacus]MBL0418838.1 dienelactone hydrolase family protein [Ramlibacter aurantiacus]
MDSTSVQTREVRIPIESGVLQGDLFLPSGFGAVVAFVNGRGQGRHCLDDRTVARQLHRAGMASLAIDLLTPEEQQAQARSGKHGVDTPLLTQRVLDVVNWIGQEPRLKASALGLCGVSAGGVVCMIAAARLGRLVQALVSVGGRPDLAGPAVLSTVKAPTLLLVGSRDSVNLARHDAAYQHLRGERSLAVVPGGGPLLEEPGVLQHAGEMAADWFEFHLAAAEEHA